MIVTLVDGPGYRVGSPSTATVTIVDNDLPPPPPPPDEPIITLSELDPEALETGPNPGIIRFHRTGDPSQAIEVQWTFSGSASNGLDFQQLPTSSPFPAGDQADLTITPLDDAEFEGNETVIVTLVDGPGYQVGSPSTAVITIVDNDEPPPLPTVTVTATDANAGEPNDTASLTVHRTGSTASSLTVTYTLGGTAQNGTDYQTLPTSVTIAAGASSANLTVNPVDDLVVESNETVIVTIVANSAYTVGNNATVIIADNDQSSLPPPVVRVLATDFLASEAGPDNGVFQISRTGSTSAAVTVRFVLAGTARNGVDYQTIASSVIIPAGAGSATITVRPVNDSLIELAETINLSLSSDPAYEIDFLWNAATVVISDNDGL